MPCIVHEPRQAAGDGVIGVFGVGEVNVDHPVEEAQCLYGVIAARVIQDGDVQPALSGRVDGRQDLRHIVAGRHQVDVVASAPLQFHHHPAHPLRQHLFARAELADGIVLAE